MSKISFILLTLFALAGCPHHNSGLPPNLRFPPFQPNIPATGLYHPVKVDENLSAIAEAYDVNVQQLAEVNNLKPPYSIQTMNEVFVPGASQIKEIKHAGSPKSGVKSFAGVLSWPVNGKIITQFGVQNGTQYNGILIQAIEETPIKTAGNGEVGYVGKIAGYGKVVLIEHPDRLVTVYGHLRDIHVKKGTPVSKGQVIGSVGSSGRTEKPALYFEVRSRSKPRNPLYFLDRKTDN